MSAVLCPLDGKPCEENCPDRYRDEPGGGCLLTTLMEFADVMIVIKKRRPQRWNTGDGRGWRQGKPLHLQFNRGQGGLQGE